MFSFLKNKFSSLGAKIKSIFSKEVNEPFFKELEEILIKADMGPKTARKCLDHLKKISFKGNLKDGLKARDELLIKLEEVLNQNKFDFDKNRKIYLFVGINGSGKTSFAAKLANYFKNKNKKILLVAADTFRAAAVEQLEELANKIGINIFKGGKIGQDPASVVFKSCEKFKNENYDILIIDTAGRLENKINLMKELEKIKRAIEKIVPEKITTLLTIDSMLGQNSFEQAKIFNEAIKINGVVLTKMDNVGKGGIVFQIYDELNIPVAYVSFGEAIDQMDKFNSEEFLNSFLNNENS